MAVRREPENPYAIGKGRPPEASRWKKGQSGNPKGRVRQSPSDAELIDRLFRRSFDVIESKAKSSKTGFAIIHAQLLSGESAGNRRAGRTRDRYEAFARAQAGLGGVQLCFMDSEPARDSAAFAEPAMGTSGLPDAGSRPADANAPRDVDVPLPNELTEKSP
jgi:hypothetical protein